MVEIDHGFTTEMRYAVAGTFTGGLSSKGYRLLKNEWYNVQQVYPVCLDKNEVEGVKAYKSLKELPEPVDVVVVVHKKDLTTEVVREAATLDPMPAIWFMPGTDSKESIAICEENKMKTARSCLMGHRRFSGIKRFFSVHYYHSKLAGMSQIPKQTE
ncbi:MAG: CoA-binding protein [Candidatus Hodarchaeales archaeon]|jgi:predicted CoA-binding protein